MSDGDYGRFDPYQNKVSGKELAKGALYSAILFFAGWGVYWAVGQMFY